jgi:exopolyphosphatase / guanosine-5'-triphosphate,3'-diphosphate pyrophosphatase
MFQEEAQPADESASRYEPARRFAGPVFAALDLGTNNCRMLMGTPSGEGFRVLDSFSRIVRLGEGLHQTGALSATAMERTLAALHACAARLQRRPVRKLRAIATEACRRAANGRAFLAQVKAETGLDVGIITAREEAELALESCAPLLRGRERRALLFDIGGGSTELAWVRLTEGRPALIGYVSLPIGVVTLAERWGSAGFSPDGFLAMVDDVVARLASFESIHCISREVRNGAVTLLGTSGTVTTLAGTVLGLQRYRRLLVDGAVLAAADADAALASLRGLGREGLIAHPCVGPDRVDFVLPGCAVFAAITRLWPAPQVIVADRGLREGMLLRMIRGERPRRGARPSEVRASA